MTGIWKKHKQTLKLAVISIIFNYIFGGLSNISHWHGVMTCLAFRGFDFGQTVKRSAFDSHQYKHHCQRGQIFARSPGMFRLKNTMTLFGLYYFFFPQMRSKHSLIRCTSNQIEIFTFCRTSSEWPEKAVWPPGREPLSRLCQILRRGNTNRLVRSSPDEDVFCSFCLWTWYKDNQRYPIIMIYTLQYGFPCCIMYNDVKWFKILLLRSQHYPWPCCL